MKKALIIFLLFVSYSFYAQNGYTVIVDGKEVFVKDDKVIPTIANPNKSHAMSGVHIVKAGESLYSISRLYNLTVDELCKMNNISKNRSLQIDQSLKIVEFSKSSTNYTNASYHIVSKGDTLYNISKRYGITIEQLKNLNNLTDNIITINQRLRVN